MADTISAEVDRTVRRTAVRLPATLTLRLGGAIWPCATENAGRNQWFNAAGACNEAIAAKPICKAFGGQLLNLRAAKVLSCFCKCRSTMLQPP